MKLQNLITKLSEHGFSDVWIARELSIIEDPVAASIVNRWRHGKHKTTTYYRHKRILDLHEKVFESK